VHNGKRESGENKRVQAKRGKKRAGGLTEASETPLTLGTALALD
jgi:hypothetical protein